MRKPRKLAEDFHLSNNVLQTIRSSLYLVGLTARRLFKSKQTLINALLLAFAVLVVIAWSSRRLRETLQFIGQILLPIHAAFLLPIFCLSYASASIASEREDLTLVYLLTKPMSRWLIHSAKFLAAALLSMLWTIGGFLFLAWLAGPAGRDAMGPFLTPLALATAGYVALFHLFSIMFRRATIVSLAYVLFLETLIGNMPGIARRATLSFYHQCLIFDAGQPFGMGPAGRNNPDLFRPIDGQTALVVILAITASLFVAGAIAFSRREYE